MGIKFLSVIGNHPLDEYLLAFTQVVLFLLGELHTLDFSWNEGIFRTHGDYLVGELVYADERRDVFTVAPFQFHHTSHVACFKQVLLVLIGENMPEIRTVKFGFLTDAVDAEGYLSVCGLLE